MSWVENINKVALGLTSEFIQDIQDAAAVAGMTVSITALAEGASATAEWNSATGILALGMPTGPAGIPGVQGVGVTSIVKIATVGKIDTYTVTFTDATTTTFEVTNGNDGTNGIDGADGLSAYDVAVGSGFVGTEAQWLASLVGTQGLQGAQGPQGTQGTTGAGVASVVLTDTVGPVRTYTITFTDATTATFDVTDGANGTTGTDGQDIDHVSLTAGAGMAGTTDTYTVWGDLGETVNLGTFNVYNGADGLGAGDMLKATYDTNNNGIVDNAALVNGLSVQTAVPSGALFTDTVYTHPTTDGSLHVPATSTTNSGKVLTAGATAGSISWQTVPSGVTDHALLTNIGTNTHAQIDTALSGLASHSHTVDGLSDAVITTPINGQVLSYSSTGSQWVNTTPTSGVTDHTLLTNIGTNTHAQIDTALTRLVNTSGTNTGDQNLSGYSLTSHSHTLDGLSDVVVTTPVTDQVLKYNGTSWINGAATAAGGTITSVTGTAPISVATGTTTPAISMSAASNGVNGYMTGTYAGKLDGIATNANNYVHPTGSGSNHIPAGGSTGQVLVWSSTGTATWGTSSGGAAVGSTTPQPVGVTNAYGSSSEASRADHVHALNTTGGIGSFIFGYCSTAVAYNATVAGSSIQAYGAFKDTYAVAAGNSMALGSTSGFGQSGTWLCLGYSAGAGTPTANVTLFLRVA